MPIFMDMDGAKLIKLFEIKNKVKKGNNRYVFLVTNLHLGTAMLLYVN